jgi:hypothetical protein
VKWRTFGAFALDDGFLTLAACCLVGDLIIQQHMWNLGMAVIPTTTREEFIEIMKVGVEKASLTYVC